MGTATESGTRSFWAHYRGVFTRPRRAFADRSEGLRCKAEKAGRT